MSKDSTIKDLLDDAAGGNRRAADVLVERVYTELRELAKQKLRGERAGHTLQPTALVHEAYLRLVGQTRVGWKGKTHFLCVAAEMMNRILKEHARGRGRQKRGGGWRKVTLDERCGLGAGNDVEAVDLVDAIEELEKEDSRAAKVAVLKVFGGFRHEEIASCFELSTRQVERDWHFARATLSVILDPS